MSATFRDGALRCEACQVSTEFDLVIKRGVGMHLCRKCRASNQCRLCGAWKRVLVATPDGPMCSRCAR